MLSLVKERIASHQYTWIITGVAGFIGSNLLESLLKLNQKVIGIDNFSTGFQSNLDDVLSKFDQPTRQLFSFYEEDIRNYEACLNAFKGGDFLLHQAALGSVPRSIQTPEITNDVNVNGFLSILRAARDTHIKSIVYASSSSVYGDSLASPKQEEQLGRPLSPYAVSKLTNELYAEAFSKCYQLSISGLRYFNVFGPRQNPKGPYAAVIPLWIESLLSDTPTFINGDGKTSRDFTFIQNVVQANLLAALYKKDSSFHQVFNIAAGFETSLEDLNLMIRKEFSKEAFLPCYREFRKGDVRHSLADIHKARDYLGYNPTHTVQEGLKITCQWYQENLNLLQKKLAN